MTHLPLASRLASLIGLPSNPSKYDGNDDDYIPYTGTFEPPPASSSRHAYAHAHTLSGSTQAAPSSTYSLSTTHPHPYNPAHSMVLTSPQTATSIATAVEEQLDRGRKRKSRPISTNSSFGPMSPLTATDYHTAPLPKTPALHNPASLGRKGGPSYLSLDGGFIGQSPVAAVPPREQRDRDTREAAKNEKHEKSAYRTSFASFMTFGGSRKSVSGASSAPSASPAAGPYSAQALTFPHGTSKLRGEITPGVQEAEERPLNLSILPSFLRQRSQSYVEETQQGQEMRRRKEEERLQHQMMDQGHQHSHHAVRVTAPTSFFDTSPFEERRAHHASSHGAGVGAGPVVGTSQQSTDVRINVPHPYHQHYRQSVGPLDQMVANVGGDTAVPLSPSYDFSHPYATTPPSTVISSPRSNVIRNSHLAPSVVRKNTLDSNRDGGGRDREKQGSYFFLNPFTSEPYKESPPPSRPITPKSRFRSLISLGDGIKTLKGSISTPNLRAAAGKPQYHVRIEEPAGTIEDGGGGTQISHSTRLGTITTGRTGRSKLSTVSPNQVPSNSIIQAQTICDTFMFPRPRLQAHQITPPGSPYSPMFVSNQSQRRNHYVPTKEIARRATAAAIMSMEERGSARQEPRSLGKKKASAPDLRPKPERPVNLRETRTLTEAEKVMQVGEARESEREEWARAARKSFQNQRSRSLSRTRTKSLAKAATAAVNAETAPPTPAVPAEKGRGRKVSATTTGTSSVPTASVVAPTAHSSSGDEARVRTSEREKTLDRDGRTLPIKSSMEYLAVKAFSQGHTTLTSRPSHSRHRSNGESRESDKEGQPRTHRRSESWGRTALKIAKNSCLDPEASSPGIERILQTDVTAPSSISHHAEVLDIKPRQPTPVNDNESVRVPSGVGIAIGTPPLDTLLADSLHIDHPYATDAPPRPFVGPHPASPSIQLTQQPPMSEIVSRHRLPPRPSITTPPRSPDEEQPTPDLNLLVPTIEATQSPMLSRESWLKYMNAIDQPEAPLERVSEEDTKGFNWGRRSEDLPGSSRSRAPNLEVDLGKRLSARDLEFQLTKAFRRQSNMSDSPEDDEHASLTFAAGATLTRLLSSRSVSRPSHRRSLSNPETFRTKQTRFSVGKEDMPFVFNPIKSADAIAAFETREAEAPRGNDGAPNQGEFNDNSLRKSTISSRSAHSPPSQDSSPSASPRAIVNLDDFEGYSDLFYRGGPGSSGSRPKSSGSLKTVNSSLDKGKRSDVMTFGSRGTSASAYADRFFSTPESTRPTSGTLWVPQASSSPLPSSMGREHSGEYNESPLRLAHNSSSSSRLPPTWDPEEEDVEDEYRLVESRQPVMPRPIIPIHRHSTKLSVIEGSVDEHATASESTADHEDQFSLRAASPTRPERPPPHAALASSGTLPVTIPEGLRIPISRPNRTSSERAIGPDGARISVITDISAQSRMSGLSDFPAPPNDNAAFSLTPSTVLPTYLPPRPISMGVPTSPVSAVSVEPPSSIAEFDEGGDQSISDHQHVATSTAVTTEGYRSNTPTFGPNTEMAIEWAEPRPVSTPTTEER